jgi:hypothetical protein
MVNETILQQAQFLLATLQDRGLIESFRYEAQEKRLEQAKQLLALFEEQKLHHFDIFRKAGFQPTETMFSNAIAALLYPKEGHGLGTLPLEKLLDRITKKGLNEQIQAMDELVEHTQKNLPPLVKAEIIEAILELEDNYFYEHNL